MKIRLLTALAGVKSFACGDVLTAGVEVSENDATRLLERELAALEPDNIIAPVEVGGAGQKRARHSKMGAGADGR